MTYEHWLNVLVKLFPMLDRAELAVALTILIGCGAVLLLMLLIGFALLFRAPPPPPMSPLLLKEISLRQTLHELDVEVSIAKRKVELYAQLSKLEDMKAKLKKNRKP